MTRRALPSRPLLVLAALTALAGCGKGGDAEEPSPFPASRDKLSQPAPPETPLPAPKLVAAGADAGATAAAADTAASAAEDGAEPIPWRHDDWPGALAAAREAKKPIVIDMWAPWCHTCLSMQHTVLRDPSVVALADRFVWLAVDTDKPENAEVLARFPLDAWPTFFVASPEEGKVEARLVGSGTPREYRDFLERGERGALATRGDAGGLADGSAAALVRQGDRAALAGDVDAARDAYAAAVAAPDVGDMLPDVLVSYIGVLHDREQWSDCVALGQARLADAARTRSSKVADFAAYAADCADRLPEGEAPAAEALRRAIIAEDSPARAVLFDDAAAISVDDRADGLRILREIHDVLGEKEAGTALAERQMALLLRAIAEAPAPRAAMTYNWPLAEVAVRLEKPELALPALLASEAALPGEYDPPYRVAWVMQQAGDAKGALPHAEKALGLAYGPRKARVLGLVADLHHALGDAAAERADREAVVALWEGLAPGQARPEALEAAKAKLAAMDAPAAP
ncbi:MAG: thioredoxin family protein [Deltaproteobacteria bacterium]|nr:thioredoxin family protein [Deltaproteobacteria bacterium]